MLKKLIIASAICLSGVAQADLVITDNLVENSKFAGADGRVDYSTTTRPAEWDYHAGNGAQFSPYGGTQRFFWGGVSGEYEAISQTIDLLYDRSISRDMIQSGNLTLNFSATMWTNVTDDSRVRIWQRDHDGNNISGGYAALGYVQNDNPIFYNSSLALHEDTRSLLILLESERDYGIHNNGYIMNPTVTLSMADTETNRNFMNIDAALSLQDAQAQAQGALVVPVQGGALTVALFGLLASRRKKQV